MISSASVAEYWFRRTRLLEAHLDATQLEHERELAGVLLCIGDVENERDLNYATAVVTTQDRDAALQELDIVRESLAAERERADRLEIELQSVDFLLNEPIRLSVIREMDSLKAEIAKSKRGLVERIMDWLSEDETFR